MNVGMTLGEVTPHSVTNADLLGSGIPIFETNGNTLGDTAIVPPESKLGKRRTRKEVTLQSYAFATPPLLGPNTLRLECTATSQHSDAGNVASPYSTITRGIKETEAMRKEFGHGMEQLKQVQTKLTKENSDHVQRAEVLMMEVDELRKEVKEIKMEGRVNQGKIEMTMATVKDLTERRISEITAIMAQRDKQADERLNCMSEMMHRRDLDVDKRMVGIMTTDQDLTLGVKTVAARVPNCHSQVPLALDPANIPSSSVPPTQQSTSREVSQRQMDIKPNYSKQPKLQTPAMYKKVPDEPQVLTASHNEIRHCDISGPPSLDPYAKSASTTGDYYSATSAQMPIEARTTTGDSEYQTAVSSNPGMKRSALSYNHNPPRPLASRTQRKTVSRRNLNPTTTEGVTKKFLENEARDYFTNKLEAERDTDKKVFALLPRRFGTVSNKIQIQQQFRMRNQSPDEDYMQYLDALEGLRSQAFPNEKVSVRRYEIMQRFIEGIRSFELKRNLALMYAQEQYVDTPPTVETLLFTVQQYLRMRGSARPEIFPAPLQQLLQQPASANQQNHIGAPAAQAPSNAQQIPQQPAAFRQQPQRTCFNCGDPSHFVADCPMKDRARKPAQQVVNSCRTNMTGEWVCPSNPRGMNDNMTPAALPEQGTTPFCINCGRAGHVESDCMVPENAVTEEQVQAAWYAPVTSSVDLANTEDQIRVISTSEKGGPSRHVVVTGGEKQILTTLKPQHPIAPKRLYLSTCYYPPNRKHAPDSHWLN